VVVNGGQGAAGGNGHRHSNRFLSVLRSAISIVWKGPEMLNGWTVIDADSHVNDWHLDWPSLVPADRHGDLPTSVRDKNGFPVLEIDGRTLPEGDREELDYTDIEGLMAQFTRDGKYWLPRPGEEDPKLRLPDMDEMGIDTAVLYGGHTFLVSAITESPGAATATLQAYNTYLASYCEAAPTRLKGVAMLSMLSPKEAADELRRCVGEFGFVGGVLPPHHATGTTLDDESMHPIWEAAIELDVPIAIHTLGTQINPVESYVKPGNLSEAYGGIPSQLALGHICGSGMLDRFPELTLAFLEVGAGWVPFMMERLEEAYEIYTMKKDRLDRGPEEIIKSGQIYFSAEPDEPLLPVTADIIGMDKLVIGSDYCHPESKCPYSMKIVAEREDLSDEIKKALLHDNPARLYRL